MLWSIHSCEAGQYPLTSITWPYRGLKCRPIEVEYFLKVIRWQITSFKWAQAEVYFFQWFIWNMLCLCHYAPALLRFCFQTNLENSASFLKCRRERPFLTMVTRLSLSTSNVYTLIVQNFTGEFMRKIYAASWKLFTLTAEADRVLCQLLTVFFPLDVLRVFCYSWLVCLLGFLVKKCVACQNSLIRFRMASFSFFTWLNA